MLNLVQGDIIQFTYKNWKGEVGVRNVMIHYFYYGKTEYHPEEQFLLKAYDFDKGSERVFAMKDMSNVIRIEEE